MSGYVRCRDVRAEPGVRAGREEAGRRELLMILVGRRLAEVRRARGLTQRQVAERMGVTRGRVSRIERGEVAGEGVVDRFAGALGGSLRQAIFFEDGDIAALAPPVGGCAGAR